MIIRSIKAVINEHHEFAVAIPLSDTDYFPVDSCSRVEDLFDMYDHWKKYTKSNNLSKVVPVQLVNGNYKIIDDLLD